MTQKLYEEDSLLREFDARVTDCIEDGGVYWAVLDRTAFFPEGGGQRGDRGLLNEIPVLDTQMTDGQIRHKLQQSIPVGQAVHGTLDWEFRFSNMQNHTGEHMLSGVVYHSCGCSNVGFHMGLDGVTVDFSEYLTPEQLARAEQQVNQIIWEDRPVTARYLQPGEEADYRSKKAIDGPIRIVTIQDCDCCACCAPHVRHTGQVGLIKILESTRHRGGTRLRMIAGRTAWQDYSGRISTEGQISRLLSAKQDRLPQAVQRLLEDRDQMRENWNQTVDLLITALVRPIPETEKNLIFFQSGFNMDQLRRLSTAAVEKTAGAAAAFSGDDQSGYTFAISGPNQTISGIMEQMRTRLQAKGGGSGQLLQGSCPASREDIRNLLGE